MARWNELARAIATIIVLASVSDCGGGGAATSPSTPSAIAPVSGDNQSGAAGQALPQPLIVKVSTASGTGVAGVSVTFAVTAGGGSVSGASASTNAQGQASIVWTLGREPGSQTAAATASGLNGSPVTFSATAAPNGTISGTITLASTFLAPPRSAAPQAGGVTLVAPARTKAMNSQGSVMRASPRLSAAPRSPSFTPDELIVTFRPEPLSAPAIGSRAMASAATARTVIAAMRARLAAALTSASVDITGTSPAILAARVRVTDPTRLDAVRALLGNDPAVATVERNPIAYADDDEVVSSSALATTLPSEPLYPWQAWHYGMIDLPAAWDIVKGSASVLVAVVDNGIRFDHPAVSGNLTSDGYDFVSSGAVPLCGGGTIDNAGDGDGYDPDPTQPADYSFDSNLNCARGPNSVGGHGLHVAGTIGAVGNDGVGVTGVNWTVRIRPVRVLGIIGAGTSYDIAQGILYAAGLPADNGAGGIVQASGGARIISMSLGGPSGSSAESLAVVAASNAGSLLIAAAGNSASPAPAYPAAYSQVLDVSSVGPDGTLAPYSNYASISGIAAPGGNLAAGDTTFGVFSTMWNFAMSVPTYQTINGTSQATPHVSGVAALVLAQNPSLTAAQLRARLTTYAVDVGAPGADNLYGAGILNARNSLTQSFAPPHQLYARLYNASIGAIVQTVPVGTGGSYAFSGLPDGNYYVFGGEDESGDQRLGVPDVGLVTRRWGAFGGTVTPATVTVAGAGTYPASFSVGLPTEIEPNNTTATAGVLVVGGYVFGRISSPSTDLDAYRVVIAQAGQYTFQTAGWIGACRFALEEDTVLGLYDSNGTLITSNDDIDAVNLNFCSRVTMTLSPGTYYVAVVGYRGGSYTVLARSGS